MGDRWILAFSQGHLLKVKREQHHLEFELGPPIPFPSLITLSSLSVVPRYAFFISMPRDQCSSPSKSQDFERWFSKQGQSLPLRRQFPEVSRYILFISTPTDRCSSPNKSQDFERWFSKQGQSLPLTWKTVSPFGLVEQVYLSCTGIDILTNLSFSVLSFTIGFHWQLLVSLAGVVRFYTCKICKVCTHNTVVRKKERKEGRKDQEIVIIAEIYIHSFIYLYFYFSFYNWVIVFHSPHFSLWSCFYPIYSFL